MKINLLFTYPDTYAFVATFELDRAAVRRHFRTVQREGVEEIVISMPEPVMTPLAAFDPDADGAGFISAELRQKLIDDADDLGPEMDEFYALRLHKIHITAKGFLVGEIESWNEDEDGAWWGESLDLRELGLQISDPVAMAGVEDGVEVTVTLDLVIRDAKRLALAGALAAEDDFDIVSPTDPEGWAVYRRRHHGGAVGADLSELLASMFASHTDQAVEIVDTSYVVKTDDPVDIIGLTHIRPHPFVSLTFTAAGPSPGSMVDLYRKTPDEPGLTVAQVKLLQPGQRLALTSEIEVEFEDGGQTSLQPGDAGITIMVEKVQHLGLKQGWTMAVGIFSNYGKPDQDYAYGTWDEADDDPRFPFRTV